MKKFIDINSDVGERPEALSDGTEEKLISMITSANIACGGHAGDNDSMMQVMKLCSKYNVGIGAHPSYPDRESFGRKVLQTTSDEITKFVYEQVYSLVKLAGEMKLEVRHVKPHGALYNIAVNDENVARAIAAGVKKVDNKFILFGLAGSKMLEVWRDEGFEVLGEAFADRRYESNGTLRSRQFADSLITDPKLAAEQALKIVGDGKIISVDGEEISIDAQTICIHSDTANSIAIVKEIKRTLF